MGEHLIPRIEASKQTTYLIKSNDDDQSSSAWKFKNEIWSQFLFLYGEKTILKWACEEGGGQPSGVYPRLVRIGSNGPYAVRACLVSHGQSILYSGTGVSHHT